MGRLLAITAQASIALALGACSEMRVEAGRDASHGGLDARAAPDASPDGHLALDAGIDASIPDGACFMVSPAARCGDGVCDPGCEADAPFECPLDCPLPDGGIPCDGGPAKWTCNANGSALTQCYGGILHVQPCGAPGTCDRVAGDYPDQCHACVPCTGWNSASPAHGQPYVYDCSRTDPEQRQRCVDVRTGGDCIQGTSDAADCCVVTDTCLGGACITQPLGVDDRCP